MRKVVLDGTTLTIQKVVDVARTNVPVELSSKALRKIKNSRQILEDKLFSEKPIYGVNTGFGELCNVKISHKDLLQLQKNLIRSHSTGIGKYFTPDITRAIMVARANTLAKGYSGVRSDIIEFLIKLLNLKIHPLIPEYGSVGASGDLVPLAHLALVYLQECDVQFGDKITNSKKLFTKLGIKPPEIHPKEGIALINGTAASTGIAALLIQDAKRLISACEDAGAVTLEALKNTHEAYSKEIMQVRNFKGQKDSAEHLRNLLAKSEIAESHKHCERVQDAYSIRCVPQIVGPVRDTLDFAKKIVTIELNSATDNPLVFKDKIICCGNFHAQYIALCIDYLSIALTTLGILSERRIARLLDTKLSNLPPFLTTNSGLNSGFMTLHYTVVNLVAENKILSSPTTIHSLPTCANQEDIVSLSLNSVLKCKKILENLKYIIGAELICASQALEYESKKPGIGVQKIYTLVRKKVKKLTRDRVLSKDLENIVEIFREPI